VKAPIEAARKVLGLQEAGAPLDGDRADAIAMAFADDGYARLIA
jgi:hypothetical protein